MFKKIFFVLILSMGLLSGGCISNSSDMESLVKEISRDTDRDGVSNKEDKCPDTTEGMEVKEDGCP
jgi:hypothetical protein